MKFISVYFLNIANTAPFIVSSVWLSLFLYFFLHFPTYLSFHLFGFIFYLFLLVGTGVEESHAGDNKVVYFPSESNLTSPLLN